MRLFFAVLALACGLSAAAAAAQETIAPQTGSWVIGPIRSDQPGSRFCSMKNTWKGGLKVVFARDAHGVNSIAFDFGGSVFEPGHEYPVSLDLPPLLTRDTTAVAATREILLVGMGRDEEFYEALGRMKALYLTVSGREYSYALGGAPDGLNELRECASGLKTAARRHEAPPPAATAEADRRALAIAREAEKRAVALEAENNRLRKALALAQRPVKPVKTAAAALNAVEPTAAPAPRAGKESLKKILAASGVVPVTGISTHESDGAKAYQWKADGVVGSAEEQRQARGFGGMVASYFERMSGRCNGDFAHTDGKVAVHGGVTIQTAEIACIGDPAGGDAAAALLFVGDGETFSAVMHETPPERLKAALAQRDAVAAAASGNQDHFK